MKRLLEVGDVFKSQRFKELIYTCDMESRGEPPKINKLMLDFFSPIMALGWKCEQQGTQMKATWIENKPGGWSREKEVLLDLSIKDFNPENEKWIVIRAEYEGGGTGMGSHDIYPDGSHIKAKMLKDGEWNKAGAEINFYQSGCFINIIEPGEIEYIETKEYVFQ